MREFRGEVKTKKEKDPTLKHSFLFSHSPAHTHRRKKRKKNRKPGEQERN
jgi:hypothetical protein